MTAQHAVRQGQRAARNIAAGYGRASAARTGTATSDSSSISAVRRRPPTRCGIPLSGLPAKAVTRGYHLLTLPGNRIRTSAPSGCWTRCCRDGPCS